MQSKEGAGPAAHRYRAASGAPEKAAHLAATNLALLWQITQLQLAANRFSAMRASLRRWSSEELEDGVAHGGQGWLRRWPVGSFFFRLAVARRRYWRKAYAIIVMSA